MWKIKFNKLPKQVNFPSTGLLILEVYGDTLNIFFMKILP